MEGVVEWAPDKFATNPGLTNFRVGTETVNGAKRHHQRDVDAQDRLLTYESLEYAYLNGGQLARLRSGDGRLGPYQYDSFGNLHTVEDSVSSDSVTYEADARGRRVLKKVNGTRVAAWLWSDDLRPVAELDEIYQYDDNDNRSAADTPTGSVSATPPSSTNTTASNVAEAERHALEACGLPRAASVKESNSRFC